MDADFRVTDENISVSWERFMILWSATPEIFIGSCIVSVFGIILTIVMTLGTRKTSEGRQGIGGHPHRHHIQDVKKRLPKTRDNEDAITPNSSDRDTGTSSPVSKKNLYKFASEKLEKSLTEEQLNEEKATKRKQLEAIYNLMKDQHELFGIKNIKQVEEQMKLYG